MKLDGKRVLVTDGSSGMGFEIAKALLAKGAKVATTGRRASTFARKFGPVHTLSMRSYDLISVGPLPTPFFTTLHQRSIGGPELAENGMTGPERASPETCRLFGLRRLAGFGPRADMRPRSVLANR
jgi:hypothetical protein